MPSRVQITTVAVSFIAVMAISYKQSTFFLYICPSSAWMLILYPLPNVFWTVEGVLTPCLTIFGILQGRQFFCLYAKHTLPSKTLCSWCHQSAVDMTVPLGDLDSASLSSQQWKKEKCLQRHRSWICTSLLFTTHCVSSVWIWEVPHAPVPSTVFVYDFSFSPWNFLCTEKHHFPTALRIRKLCHHRQHNFFKLVSKTMQEWEKCIAQ